jgi:hypothetical protein
MKEIKKKIKSSLFFISMATVAKFVLPIPIFFGTKPGHHAVTSFTKPGPAILT